MKKLRKWYLFFEILYLATQCAREARKLFKQKKQKKKDEEKDVKT